MTIVPAMKRAGRFISSLTAATGTLCLEELACAGWSAAVGEKIAVHTRAVSFASGRLRIEVEDAIWQRQLSVLKGQILARLDDIVGTAVIRDIEFRIVPGRRMPQIASEARKHQDDADEIQDPVLRGIYRRQRGRRSA
jgi:predicted nucleic acid-binding Zn ribbon protein